MIISKHFFLTIFIIVIPIILPACCFGEYFSITELLNHDPGKHQVFTCRILKSYQRGHGSGGYESIAVVQRRFIGSPNDTIFINSGGSTTAGGGILTLNAEYLIFSTSTDNINFNAFVCDFLSTQITERAPEDCGILTNEFGKLYLEVLELYEQIKKDKYTGHKNIIGAGKLIAKGKFINGIPDGDWTHYSRNDYFDKEIIRSEISYKKGMLNGNYHIYSEDAANNKIKEKRMYESDFPVRIEILGHRTADYEYFSEKERKVKWTYLDSSHAEVKQLNFVQLDYQSLEYNLIEYKEGYFINKWGRDSSSYSPLAEGYYSRGTRIGEWKFFNKKGEVVMIKNYPDRIVDKPYFETYDDEGNVKVSGLYVDGKRTGSWKYYYDKRLVRKEIYNLNGALISDTNYYSSGGFRHTPHRNMLKHGLEIVYNEDLSVSSIEEYVNGKLNGMNIIFNEDGTLQKHSYFINSREFSVYSDDNTFISNGFVSGYYIQYNYKTGEKMYEGELWNGHRTGIWILYRNDGNYTKSYYPLDKDELMKGCSDFPELTEQYDQENKLTKSWKLGE